MEQALQQWRLVHGVEDDAYESLIAIVSAHTFGQENFSAGAFPPVLSPNLLISHVDDGDQAQSLRRCGAGYCVVGHPPVRGQLVPVGNATVAISVGTPAVLTLAL